MLRLALLLVGVSAWKHFASFNDECGADLSLFRGTQVEAKLTAGRVPYQFKNALQEVLKARVAAEGCTLSLTEYNLFFGLEAANLVRFLDSADTTLSTTNFPCSNLGGVFDFNWKHIKANFQGVVMPSSCTSAGFAGSGCKAKLKILDNFFVEVSLQDTCKDETKNGFGLPQITITCSGSLCDSMAKPCVSDNDCGSVTCDGLGVYLNDTDLRDSFIDMGMLSAADGTTKCDADVDPNFVFQERFMSQAINRLAYLVGLSGTSVSGNKYHELKLCGVNAFKTKFIPPEQPQPEILFKCPGGNSIQTNLVCNGANDCPNGEDEQFCRCWSQQDQKLNFDGIDRHCCPICPDSDTEYRDTCNRDKIQCPNNYCGTIFPDEPGPKLCDNIVDGQPINCPDFLQASQGTTLDPAVTLNYASTTAANTHVVGWADCDGNVQLGNPSEIAVANAHLPFQNIAKQAEEFFSSIESCRVGATPTPDWAKFFYVWSVNLWGGIFYTNQDSGPFGTAGSLGAVLDRAVRFYKSASKEQDTCPSPTACPCGPNMAYVNSPPFQNMFNAPSTCNEATTTAAAGGKCELGIDISNWFKGTTFPAGWGAGTTMLKLRAESTCSTSKFPSIYITCDGPCTATSKSGCCILKEAFTAQSTAGQCPPGYKLEVLNATITDFLINGTTTKSFDTTISNFFNLLATRNYKFGPGFAKFVPVKGTDNDRSICVIDGEGLKANQDSWASASITEECPNGGPFTAGSEGCPQFLPSSSFKACDASCNPAPQSNSCGAACPLVPTPAPATDDAALAIPSVALLGMMLLM